MKLSLGAKILVGILGTFALMILGCVSAAHLAGRPDLSLKINDRDRSELKALFDQKQLDQLQLVYAYRAGGLLRRSPPPKVYIAEITPAQMEAFIASPEHQNPDQRQDHWGYEYGKEKVAAYMGSEVDITPIYPKMEGYGSTFYSLLQRDGRDLVIVYANIF